MVLQGPQRGDPEYWRVRVRARVRVRVRDKVKVKVRVKVRVYSLKDRIRVHFWVRTSSMGSPPERS